MKNFQSGSRGSIYNILAWIFLLAFILSTYGNFYGSTNYSSLYQYLLLITPLIALPLSIVGVWKYKNGYISFIFSILATAILILYIYIGRKIG